MSHFEKSLERDRDRIRDKLSRMAKLAQLALEQSVQALVDKNRQLAYSVILRDQRIDELEKEIDRLCLEFIVRHQPAAAHLRLVYAAIKINTDLERAGDYAESIARQVLALSSMDFVVPAERFLEIADKAIPMLADAARAFIDQDHELARRTLDTEDIVDQLRHALSRDLVRLRKQEEIPLEALPLLQNICNRLERVADQARNICHEALYSSTGEYLKHRGSDVFRLLFVDDDNTCSSQMAEAIGHSLEQPLFVFSSAGLDPRPPEPALGEFLRDRGLGAPELRTKSVQQVPHLEEYHVIVALTREAQRVWPPPPTKVVCLDWSSEVPPHCQGTPEQVRGSYERVYRFLDSHIRDLVQAILADQQPAHESAAAGSHG